MGEKPNNQMSRAETTGIQRVYRLTLADFAMLKVGAAISATTATYPFEDSFYNGIVFEVMKKHGNGQYDDE